MSKVNNLQRLEGRWKNDNRLEKAATSAPVAKDTSRNWANPPSSEPQRGSAQGTSRGLKAGMRHVLETGDWLDICTLTWCTFPRSHLPSCESRQPPLLLTTQTKVSGRTERKWSIQRLPGTVEGKGDEESWEQKSWLESGTPASSPTLLPECQHPGDTPRQKMAEFFLRESEWLQRKK